MSTLFDIFNPKSMQPSPKGQMPNMISQLKQFAGGLTGNPEQIVRNLLSSGQMSQECFDNLAQQATQIQNMFGLR